jgi:hypothetical protein
MGFGLAVSMPDDVVSDKLEPAGGETSEAAMIVPLTPTLSPRLIVSSPNRARGEGGLRWVASGGYVQWIGLPESIRTCALRRKPAGRKTFTGQQPLLHCPMLG